MRVELSPSQRQVTPELKQTVSQAPNGLLSSKLINQNDKLVAELLQTPTAKTKVDLYNGKGGQTAIVRSTDGLVYLMLPGSNFKNDDTEIHLPGKKLEPTVKELTLPKTNTPTQAHTDQGIILGAGIGERLDPISGLETGFSKPGIPLLGSKSILRNIAEHMKKHGVQNLITQTYYFPDAIKDQLKGLDGVNVKYIHEVMMPPGTASAIMKAFIQGDLNPNKPTIIIAGDAVTNYDLSHLVNKHHEKNAAITIAGKLVTDEEVPLFGMVQSDNAGGDGQSGNITQFKEKPKLKDAGSARLANTAIYVISPEVLPLLRKVGEQYYKNYKGGTLNFDFAMNVFPALMDAVKKGEIKNAKTGKPMTFWVEQMQGGYWDDVGNPTTYYRNVIAAAKGYLGFEVPQDQLEKFTDNNGVVYWNGSKQKVAESGVKVDGNIIVAESALRKGVFPKGHKLNATA